MSRYYGTVAGQAQTTATRRGSKRSGLVTYCASWSGAVRCEAWHDDQTDTDLVRVELIPWHGAGVNRTLFVGPINGAQTDRGAA